jgi:dihydroorotate dehydrogenase (NAD+) catalytic subunit
VTNSFGMPSRDREFLKEDIPRANSLLREGQVMIVSVVGTPSSSTCGSSPTTTPQDSYTEFVRDFVDTALFAKNCGAQIIEANFSCPNVATGEGSIFQVFLS